MIRNLVNLFKEAARWCCSLTEENSGHNDGQKEAVSQNRLFQHWVRSTEVVLQQLVDQRQAMHAAGGGPDSTSAAAAIVFWPCGCQFSARCSSTHYEGEMFTGRIQSVHCILNNWNILPNHILEVSLKDAADLQDRSLRINNSSNLQKPGSVGWVYILDRRVASSGFIVK